MSTNKRTVERVLEWAAMGVRLGGIANAVQAEGLKLPEGASTWNSAAVRGILEGAGVEVSEVSMGTGETAEDEDDAEEELLWPQSHCGTGFEPDLP